MRTPWHTLGEIMLGTAIGATTLLFAGALIIGGLAEAANRIFPRRRCVRHARRKRWAD